MIYCLNPSCPHPQNSDAAQVCEGCGHSLWIQGRYQAIQCLGHGAIKQTWLAKKRVQGTDQGLVVLKQRRGQVSHPSVSHQVAKQFREEVVRLQRLGEHPQIPLLLDALDHEFGQLLVYEYVQGPNLTELIEKQGPFAARQVKALLLSLLSVLEYVQSFRGIHRDIKPVNIIQSPLTTPQTSDHSPPWMLVDFGTLYVMPKTALKPSSTLTSGAVMGSPEYVAPEQAMGQPQFASDLYSLGLVCLYGLTGLSPFELYSVSESRWVWRDFLTQPLDQGFAKVLDQLLVRSLADRYRRADEALLDLQKSSMDWAQRLSQGLALPTFRQHVPKKAGRFPAKSLVSWTLRCRITEPIGISSAVAVSDNGRLFITGSVDGSLYLWDLVDGGLIHAFKRKQGLRRQGHGERISRLQWDLVGQRFYSTSEEGTLKIWDLETYRLIETWTQNTPVDIDYSPRGGWAVSADRLGKITIFAADQLAALRQGNLLKPFRVLNQHRDQLTGLSLSAQGQRLASASRDGTVRIWTIPDGQLIQTIKLMATALIMHPSGNHVITGDKTGQVKVWHVGPPLTSDPLCQLEDRITALALSPDARLVAVGSEANELTLWRGTTGECVSRLAQGWGSVAIAFSPDGQTLISTSRDETISVWQKES